MLQKKNKYLPLILSKIKRGHFIIAVIIAIALLIVEGIFLYKYFYTALAESKQLKELKQQAALEELKISKFEEIQKFYNDKQKERPIDWDALRDPFTSF